MDFFNLDPDRPERTISAEFCGLVLFIAAGAALFWGFIHYVGPVLKPIFG